MTIWNTVILFFIKSLYTRPYHCPRIKIHSFFERRIQAAPPTDCLHANSALHASTPACMDIKDQETRAVVTRFSIPVYLRYHACLLAVFTYWVTQIASDYIPSMQSYKKRVLMYLQYLLGWRFNRRSGSLSLLA